MFALASLFISWLVSAPGDWPEVRQNAHLTACQPLPGAMRTAPECDAIFDLGRSRPPLTILKGPDGLRALAVVGGALHAYEPTGALLWTSHPPGLNFTRIVSADDFDGDGEPDVLLSAGRPAEPFGAAVIVSLADGAVRWRYDVEPMSYAWYLYAGDYLPDTATKQIAVIVHAYPPDKDNGYMVLFVSPNAGHPPQQKWRYDFSEYTCFPSFLQTDLDGDGVKELAVETHSRMWLLDAVSGTVKQFLQWDVSPGNIRSYGHVEFVDLDRDGREDFLCIANFAQHHEVLLNRGGKLEKAWHYGWPESVTTGKVATVWMEPPYADIDGDGRYEIVLSMFNAENDRAWQVRAYDAVSGAIKYRYAGMIVAAGADLDGDNTVEILGNASSDPSQTVLSGAHALKVKDGGLAPVWSDDKAKALPHKAQAHIEREGAVLVLALDADGAAHTTPWHPPAQEEKPDCSAIPATQGPPLPALLAADVNSDGINELIVYQEPRIRILQWKAGTLSSLAEYESSALPVFGDFNGDGKSDMALVHVVAAQTPTVEAVSPALENKRLWQTVFPPSNRTGLPQPRKAYARTIRLTRKPMPDLYVWVGTPIVRSAGMDGQTGAILWDKGESPNSERYWGPSVNFASAFDFNNDGKEDLLFTNPDYYCIASGHDGSPLLGPLYPPDIFKQPSQGLYTYPAILERKDLPPVVCLVAGHYFQAGMTMNADPLWYHLPRVGENRAGMEAFMRASDGTWLMGFGRQNGYFACLDAATGQVRWELPVDAACSDTVACDIDGNGRFEFVFGTSHGQLIAVGDNGATGQIVWKSEAIPAIVGTPIIADLDGDGCCEIACAATDGYVRVFTGPANRQ